MKLPRISGMIMIANCLVNGFRLERMGFSTARTARLFSSTSSATPRLYASYNIYKPQGVLGCKPIPPSVKPGTKTIKEGSLLFEFTPFNSNLKEYEWSRKQFFALSIPELGDLIAFDKARGIEFIHESSKGLLIRYIFCLFSYLRFTWI